MQNNKSNRVEVTTARSVIKYLGDISLFNLSNQDLAEFRDQQIKLVGPTTVVHRLSLLSTVLKIAHQEWNISFPKGIPNVRKPKRPNGRDRRLEEGELDLLTGALNGSTAAPPLILGFRIISG